MPKYLRASFVVTLLALLVCPAFGQSCISCSIALSGAFDMALKPRIRAPDAALTNLGIAHARVSAWSSQRAEP